MAAARDACWPYSWPGGDDGERVRLEGPQGFLRAMDSAGTDLEHAGGGPRLAVGDRRHRHHREALSVSCAATTTRSTRRLAPPAPAKFTADDVERVEVDVDRITPTVLIYDRPASGLEAKFSLPFCAAAAVVDGRVGIDVRGQPNQRRAGGDADVSRHDDRRSGAWRGQARADAGARASGFISATAARSARRPMAPAAIPRIRRAMTNWQEVPRLRVTAIEANAAEQSLALLRNLEDIDDIRA